MLFEIEKDDCYCQKSDSRFGDSKVRLFKSTLVILATYAFQFNFALFFYTILLYIPTLQ